MLVCRAYTIHVSLVHAFCTPYGSEVPFVIVSQYTDIAMRTTLSAVTTKSETPPLGGSTVKAYIISAISLFRKRDKQFEVLSCDFTTTTVSFFAKFGTVERNSAIFQ